MRLEAGSIWKLSGCAASRISAIRRRPAGRVDHRQRAATIADDDLLRRLVHPDVVRIVAELDPSVGRVVRPLKEPQRPVAPVGDEQRVARRQIADPLRLLHPGEAAYQLASLEIDDTDAVVAELGDEQPTAIEIDRHVIDASAHRAERDLAFELQRRIRRLGGRRIAAHHRH
jgi:hypothetical protein